MCLETLVVTIIRKRRKLVPVKGASYSRVGLSFVLLLTESRLFRITADVSKHILHAALFYK